MFKVDQFLNHFNYHNDFARISRFEVLIAPPPSAPDFQSYDLRFQCEASELPGYSINTVDNRIYGVSQPVASVAAFNDITLTFICAGDMWEKKLFDKWMNLVIPVNNYNPRYKNDYTSPKIEINQYTDVVKDTEVTSTTEATASSQKIYSAVLINAFPVSISPLSLNWAEDGFHRLSVGFKFDYWTTGDLTKVSPDAKPTIPSGSTPPRLGTQTVNKPTRGNPPPTQPASIFNFNGRGG